MLVLKMYLVSNFIRINNEADFWFCSFSSLTNFPLRPSGKLFTNSQRRKSHNGTQSHLLYIPNLLYTLYLICYVLKEFLHQQLQSASPPRLF